MHARAYMLVLSHGSKMFSASAHYGIPSSNPSGAKPRMPDTRTLGERLSDATLTSASPGGGRNPMPLEGCCSVGTHFSFLLCETPTHILGGGIQSSSKDFGKILHPEMELRLLCRACTGLW